MKSAVFFDIDGTLLDGKNYIPQSTIAGIKKLQQAGHYAFLCSGRSRGYITNPELLAIGFDGIVCGCGTHVEVEDQTVYEKLVDPMLMKRTIETCRSYNLRPIVEGPVHLYLDSDEYDENNHYGKKIRKEVGNNLLSIEGNLDSMESNKLSCLGNEFATDEDKKECLQELADDFDFLIHKSSTIEMVPKGHSKATGIEEVCKYLGIEAKNTYAFGDSVNDIEMFDYVGTGIAMGNATDEAKNAADYITDTLKEDGVYKGLLHFGLIA